MENLQVKNGQFYLGEKPFRILSGAVHYFRTPPQYWRDRLLKLKACGLNTVETYVAWNLHEPKEGQFCFEGICDLEKFIQTADQLGLKVIIRPGPYICAEWDFGGFPGWLIRDRSMRLRCNYPPYLEKVDAYFDVLIPKLVPYLSTHGGPILAMQVENEYGSYGNDKEYLAYLEKGLLARGVDCLLFTSDGDDVAMLNGGTLPHLLKTVNFGSNPQRNFASLRKVQPNGPVMCCEFWDGWFDHWGNEHHGQAAETVAQVLDDILSDGGSFNLYMFHGGTNFGFYNGANFYETYCPTATSYDYDALLTEAGDLTEKYHLCKKVLEKHFGKAEEIPVANSPKADYGTVALTQRAPLFQNLSKLSTPVRSACPLSMEEIGQGFGFLLYRTMVKGPVAHLKLDIKGLAHRALVFLDGVYQGVIFCGEENPDIFLDVNNGKYAQLDLLVENMGRVNYGDHLGEPSGISGGVKMGYQFQSGWDIYPLELPDLSSLVYEEGVPKVDQPSFYRGTFHAAECKDTFVLTENLTKGVIFINGIHLGRYWEKGPQKTLYLPAPFLKEGENVLEILELHSLKKPEIQLIDHPILG